jgi:hypothetical protein
LPACCGDPDTGEPKGVKMAKRKAKTAKINNLVVVSDIHAGCQLALCPPEVLLDEGGTYRQSPLQRKLWSMWEEFWGETVPDYTHGEPYAVVFNGDAVDGVHHNSTTQITHNMKDQIAIAIEILAPIVEACEGRYYHIRGTEAHVGKSASSEEGLAKALGARPDAHQYARNDLWVRVGGGLVHLLHHIGSTGSLAYETTAVMKELTESYVEAARWGRQPPDMIVRSHRHRYCELAIPTSNGKARAVVTPAWQGKTPFVWKIPGARLSTPMFGGIVIRWSEDAQVLFVREKVWTVDPSPVVTIEG